MYTTTYTICGQQCPAPCAVLYHGIENTYTIGIHSVEYPPVVHPDAPVDLAELKYHLGLWFTKVAADITAVAVESACGRGRRATACNAMCANRNIPSAIYGSLGRADMERLTIKKQRTPPRGKGKAKRGEPSAESAEEWQPLFVNGVCMACHELRMAALYSAYAAGATSMSEADAYADALMSPWPEKATMAPDPISAPTSATQAPPRPQTCACDLCENSPARYARQSDSGIEDQ